MKVVSLKSSERYSKIKEEHKEEQAEKDSYLVRFSRIGGVMSTFYQSSRRVRYAIEKHYSFHGIHQYDRWDH